MLVLILLRLMLILFGSHQLDINVEVHIDGVLLKRLLLLLLVVICVEVVMLKFSRRFPHWTRLVVVARHCLMLEILEAGGRLTSKGRGRRRRRRLLFDAADGRWRLMMLITSGIDHHILNVVPKVILKVKKINYSPFKVDGRLSREICSHEINCLPRAADSFLARFSQAGLLVQKFRQEMRGSQDKTLLMCV